MSHLLLQEITVWQDNTPNHSYITSENKSRLLGYIKEGTTTPIMLKKPTSFSVKGRRFKLIARI